MKSIICGAGAVGQSIAEKLSNEGFEVTVVDESKEQLKKISDNLDVKTVIGPSSHPSILSLAGAKDCDILIAVTKSDENNMISCQIGYSLFKIPTKIARIRQQDYLKGEWMSLYNKENLPIDAIISPENEVAKAIFRRLHAPGAIDMVELANNKLKLVGLKCEDQCPILNTSIRELSKKFQNTLSNILLVIRNEEKFVVNSKTTLKKNDIVYFVVDNDDFIEVMKAFGHEETEAQKIVIIGGGNIGYSLAKKIDEEDKNITTHLIESDKKRAEFLASNLESVSITNGDALENEILDEVNISEAGNFIAVTNDDEVNILSSLLAKRAGAQSCMTLINNSSYGSLLNNIGIDITIDPKLVTISKILEKVRSGRIMNDYTIADGFGEVIEAEILPNSAFTNKKLSEMNLSKNIRVGAILRDKKIIIPNSETIFKENDDVVFFSETTSVKKLEKLLSIRQQYS
ncbi:MAG: Trk system potassium uptake protein TrkA [Alphaproteobacteria bacterium MarineAlpha5_Bin6]|nr:MAG: Trk system potassium uptake protein TrkA [Alphaproteobacteria bacterium MarineAlpha5_Bin7]PPR53665.1 MAG: Trk system potassium uptake protein TrkA [Alphaproteobacteria bacterium MarineAlpha5_Bin6]|tara:strand:- start:784 stop:2160 length:1377 start_codon:yes stop_codon:yes gene_type:complete